MGMGRGLGQDILHNSCGESTGSLILLQDDANPQADFYIIPIHAVHDYYLSDFLIKSLFAINRSDNVGNWSGKFLFF